jgi:lambda repressor-like predicted transcriptional regulator
METAASTTAGVCPSLMKRGAGLQSASRKTGFYSNLMRSALGRKKNRSVISVKRGQDFIARFLFVMLHMTPFAYMTSYIKQYAACLFLKYEGL